MTESALAPLIGSVALLERAITYTLGSLHLVTPAAMGEPTPCRAWDLRALLGHMDDSLTALDEALDTGHVALDPLPPATDPVSAVKDRACRLLGAWSGALDRDAVTVAGCPVTTTVVMTAGAVEIAVHGWDVAKACGQVRPLPTPLAEELLALAPLFVTPADRPGLFARPVAPPPGAGPTDRLIAYLGRTP
jgi:uncharacterized protein (TIGR03086 family)